MEAGALNIIVGAFVNSLQTGMGVLSQYSLGILAFTALVAWCSSLWPMVMGNENGMATALMLAVRIAVFYWITTGLAAMGIAAFHSFLQWGTAPSGGAFTVATFMSPSTMLNTGLAVARPIQDFLKNLGSVGVLVNFWTSLGYAIAFWAIILSFALITFHLIVTIIEFHLALMTGAVLIPWGALSATAFLCEFSISWIVGQLLRVMLTAGIMSIAVPLISLLKFRTTSGGDPTLPSAIIFAVAAVIFAILAWQVPSRAAAAGGRGMALALTGGMLLPASGPRAVTYAMNAMANVGGAAVSGASRMLASVRG